MPPSSPAALLRREQCLSPCFQAFRSWHVNGPRCRVDRTIHARGRSAQHDHALASRWDNIRRTSSVPIDYEKRDGVAYITLNNPGKANILDKPTSDAISEAWIDSVGRPRYPLRHRHRRGRPAFLRWPQPGATPGSDSGGPRISPHAAHLLAARGDGAWAEDRGRWPHGRPLSAGLEAGHRRDQWLGRRGGAVYAADLHRYPHRQRGECPVQIRTAEPGLAWQRSRREHADQAASLCRRDEDSPHRRTVRCRRGAARGSGQ